MNPDAQAQFVVALVYCLYIDLIGSTKRGLEFTTAGLDRFNRALVDQIKPHLIKLGLKEILIKFTGDGWLLMTDKPEKVPALCCLASIMANGFQLEVSQAAEISADLVPPLRVTICAGRDIAVDLPNGNKDWVGDSARRATRASGYCQPNEILIDYAVYSHVVRDFHHERVDISTRSTERRPKKEEEELPLYVLGGMKAEAAEGLEVSECFVYTLSILGKYEGAKAVGKQIVKRLADEATEIKQAVSVEGRSLEQNVQSWNRLVAMLPDFSSARETLVSMQEAGVSPDVITYNTLLDKAPDYRKAKALVATMRKKGIQPDVFTYTTLIYKAPDYEAAKDLLTKMQEEDIQPNVVTYSTLINKAPDYETAKDLLTKMQEEGIQPNVFIYTLVFGKDLSRESGKSILRWYFAQLYHPEVPIQAAIAAFRRSRRLDQALILALNYPHLKASQRLFHEHSKQAIQYFKDVLQLEPLHPNAHYALGITFMAAGKQQEAKGHLAMALDLASHETRKADIRQRLSQINP